MKAQQPLTGLVVSPGGQLHEPIGFRFPLVFTEITGHSRLLSDVSDSANKASRVTPSFRIFAEAVRPAGRIAKDRSPPRMTDFRRGGHN
jgi:hypothetical protein